MLGESPYQEAKESEMKGIYVEKTHGLVPEARICADGLKGWSCKLKNLFQVPGDKAQAKGEDQCPPNRTAAILGKGED
ncbi:hypothetical protein H920_05243 [Fukomys damarensis]|uniref:Uncharacterized protein n=1 Tax=Fukomys damarensis TaxID=885580 RepID=A0A091DSU6_FUKDA|nr:hypothetical protein H920_05243 [Fukomys damarensis]